MAILTLQKLSKSYGVNTVFENIDLTVNEGDIVGLIGQNGAGKTTLFKAVSGSIPYDSGSVIIPKSTRVASLDQLPDIEDKTVYEYCLDAYSQEFKLIERREELEHLISESSKNGGHCEESLLDEYSNLLFEIEASNIYAFESEIKGTLKGLGFKEEDCLKDARVLSGGERSRLGLCRLLLTKPDLALLDEPTNHLDTDSMLWLENYIKKSGLTFIIISHDRYFLDQIATSIVEIENHGILQNKGNYSAFIRYKEAFTESELKKHEKVMAEVERQTKIITIMKQRGTEKLANRALSREKALEKLDIPLKPFKSNPELKLLLSSKKQPGNDILAVDAISKSFGERNLFNDLSFQVYKGDRIGIIGANGTGKSTILRILTGEIHSDKGSFRMGTGVEIGYYDQNLKSLSESNNLIEEVSQEFPSLDITKIRTLLGAFLFTGDDVFKTLSNLSGGERARISLLRLMLKGDNFLLLDEPTNHLDIYSRENVESALEEFDGTMVAVSHDRYFLNKICSRILLLEDGRLTEFHGNYDYYMEKIQQDKLLQEEAASGISPDITKTQIKADKRLEKAKREESKKIKSQIKDIESSIEKHESMIADYELMLCDESIYSDFSKVKEINDELQSCKEIVSQLYEKWEELST